MGDLLSEVSLSGLLHLDQDHGGDFLGSKDLLALVGLQLDVRLGVLLNDLEWEVLDVVLDCGVGPIAANEPLGVENGVLGVGGQLVLGSITNQTLTLSGESNVGGGDTVALVVGDDLNAAVLEHSDTGKLSKLQSHFCLSQLDLSCLFDSARLPKLLKGCNLVKLSS